MDNPVEIPFRLFSYKDEQITETIYVMISWFPVTLFMQR